MKLIDNLRLVSRTLRTPGCRRSFGPIPSGGDTDSPDHASSPDEAKANPLITRFLAGLNELSKPGADGTFNWRNGPDGFFE